MSVQYDATPRVGLSGENIATTLGVAAIGGGVAVRVIVDDSVVLNKDGILHILRYIENAITKQTHPAS